MKKLKVFGLVIACLALCLGIAFGTWKFGNHYLAGQDAAAMPKFAACHQHGQTHMVTIENNKANPAYTSGKLCDTLTIINEDKLTRLIAFGPHEHHQPYDGITDKLLTQNQSLTVTMNETGTYHFHDHIGDIVQGDFTVIK